MSYALAVRSHFSLGESLLTPKRIIERAKELDYHAVALTDTMTISGMVEFVQAAKKESVKAIVGCRLRVVEDPRYRKERGKKEKKQREWYPKVYVKNEDGLRDLMALLSLAYDAEHFYYVPRLGVIEVLEALKPGNLVFSTGDLQSLFNLSEPHDYSTERLLEAMWPSLKASETFFELVPIDNPLFDTLNKRAILACKGYGAAPLLIYPMLYDASEDAKSLEVMAAIIANHKMSDPWRNIQWQQDFYLQGEREIVRKAVEAKKRLAALYDTKLGPDWGNDKSWKAAYENQALLADLCSYEWKKQTISLPQMVWNEYAALVEECRRGWRERFERVVLGDKPSRDDLRDKYAPRLKYELSVLKKMGFERYFLLVQDLVKWAKTNGIMVGPGRGSVGGSLVAYLLGITDVDPIRFNLLFERFINPERIDLPDADLDFMSSRREEVVNYLVEKYGAENVAGITNYGALAAASAIRDVSRVFELDPKEYECSKYAPKEHGQPIELARAVEMVPEIAAFRDRYPEIWKHCLKLEGVMRNYGQHAAGVVVAGEPIVHRAVVETRTGSRVVNWDKRSVEDWGLVKIDILGLSTLDVINLALQYIEASGERVPDLYAIGLDDPDVMDAFGRGETIGVFQFESPGMRKLLKDLARSGRLTFEDLAAATALYRPGPMDSGLLGDYVAIKNGEKTPYYDHPSMEHALKDTLGVMIYQEEVMQIARDVAGYSMAEADKLRKIMGKKLPEEMAKERDKFVAGCIKHGGMNEIAADTLFSKIAAFAGYGFNRSHAIEYSIISYWTMWLKVKYPAPFYAAALSILGEDKLPGLVADAARHNVHVVPPDINRSTKRFEIAYDSTREQHILITPFSALKGLSDKTADAILEARAKVGRFTSKSHFLDTVNKTRCNKNIQAVLERVGAFAEIEPGSLPARHPDRLRDQLELMPGLVIGTVKADRDIVINPANKTELIKMVDEVRACKGCDLAGGAHPVPRLGKTPKFMVVTDCPTLGEERALKMLEGDSAEWLKASIKNAGLSINDGYYTALVKSPKSKKMVTPDQINACSRFLRREIEILKPPVIVALGGAAIRYFVPDVKGGIEENLGRVVFVPKLDANVVLGFNPLQLFFDSAKQKWLDEVFAKVADLVS